MADVIGYTGAQQADGTQIPEGFDDIGGGAYAAKRSLSSSEEHLGFVSGHTFRSEVTLARPNDANAYVANDAVMDSTSAPTALNFASCARSAGGGITLMQGRMTINKQMGTTRYRLHLFRDTPSSLPNDNAAYAQLWANASLRIGYIDFATPAVGSDCTDYFGTFVQQGAVPTVLVGTSVRGILQVLDGVTPAGTDQYKIVLTGYQD